MASFCEAAPDLLDGPWYYDMIELGHNLRMSDIQTALGAAHMTRLAELFARRNELARRYDMALGGLSVGQQSVSHGTESAYRLNVIRVEASDRAEVFRRPLAVGIGVNVHHVPMHLQPSYQRIGFGPGTFPEAARYYRKAITLPLFPALTGDEQDVVIAAAKDSVR